MQWTYRKFSCALHAWRYTKVWWTLVISLVSVITLMFFFFILTCTTAADKSIKVLPSTGSLSAAKTFSCVWNINIIVIISFPKGFYERKLIKAFYIFFNLLKESEYRVQIPSEVQSALFWRRLKQTFIQQLKRYYHHHHYHYFKWHLIASIFIFLSDVWYQNIKSFCPVILQIPRYLNSLDQRSWGIWSTEKHLTILSLQLQEMETNRMIVDFFFHDDNLKFVLPPW